jgi:hypothetical protein
MNSTATDALMGVNIQNFDSRSKKRFIHHMVVVESSEELEEMIENDVMEELERCVRNRINEVQGV